MLSSRLRSWTLRVLAGVGVCANLLMAGCASISAEQTHRLLEQRPADLPAHVELTATPFFAQTDHRCGPAALATALGAAGVSVDPAQLSEEVFVPAREGSLQVEMLAGARRHGAVPVRLPRSMKALLRQVADGTPVVVLVNLSLAFVPVWHYAVVVGYDLDAHQVILRSGTSQRQLMDLSTFELTWARSGRWAFVVVPPGQVPAQATEAAVTEALVAFERVAQPDVAATAYAAAWKQWPANFMLGMGLGNSRFAGEDYYAAAVIFFNMAERYDSAAAWNNLARARLKMNHVGAAQVAAQNAVRRAELAEPRWLDAAQATLRDVQAASAAK